VIAAHRRFALQTRREQFGARQRLAEQRVHSYRRRYGVAAAANRSLASAGDFHTLLACSSNAVSRDTGRVLSASQGGLPPSPESKR
jgi:hypothetical protein